MDAATPHRIIVHGIEGEVYKGVVSTKAGDTDGGLSATEIATWLTRTGIGKT